MASLSAYFITDYANNLQLSTLNMTEVPNSYKLLFDVSKVTSAIVPVAIVLFIVITTKIMLNEFFDKRIPSHVIFRIVGFSMIPMLLYYYFFWFNLIKYCNIETIKSTEDLLNMNFLFNLHLNDFTLLSYFCWLLMFIYIIFGLIKHKVNATSAVLSTLLPSGIFMIVYCLIK